MVASACRDDLVLQATAVMERIHLMHDGLYRAQGVLRQVRSPETCEDALRKHVPAVLEFIKAAAGPRPHIRRAHWHTILSGPRRRDGVPVSPAERQADLRGCLQSP